MDAPGTIWNILEPAQHAWRQTFWMRQGRNKQFRSHLGPRGPVGPRTLETSSFEAISALADHTTTTIITTTIITTITIIMITTVIIIITGHIIHVSMFSHFEPGAGTMYSGRIGKSHTWNSVVGRTHTGCRGTINESLNWSQFAGRTHTCGRGPSTTALNWKSFVGRTHTCCRGPIKQNHINLKQCFATATPKQQRRQHPPPPPPLSRQ